MSLTKVSSALPDLLACALDHPRAAIVEHERGGGSVADELPRARRVKAHGLGEGERLSRNGDVRTAQQLVDELDLLPVSGLRPDHGADETTA